MSSSFVELVFSGDVTYHDEIAYCFRDLLAVGLNSKWCATTLKWFVICVFFCHKLSLIIM